MATVAAAVALEGAPSAAVTTLMLLAGAVAGGLWIGFVGGLRHYRGVNETISSLLLNYIAIAIMSHLVLGLIRDPAVLHRPSSWHVGEANMLGLIPGMDVHWGLIIGAIVCLVTVSCSCGGRRSGSPATSSAATPAPRAWRGSRSGPSS